MHNSGQNHHSDRASPGLLRGISLPMLTFYGLGTIIGAGIYVLIGEVVGLAGYLAPLSFLLAAIIAGFTAFTYAELSSRYPRSAGEAWYLKQAFVARWPSLVAGWSIVAVGVVSSATIVNGFAGYLHEFIHIRDWMAVSLVVITLGLVAAWGIRESVWLATVLTLLEIGGLVMVFGLNLDSINHNSVNMIISDIRTEALSPILAGAFLAFYAFIGFEDMVNVAEEVKDPHRTLPRAIMFALLISTTIYIAIASIAVMAMDPQLLSLSDAPLTELARRHSESAATAITLIGLVAVINGALIQIIMATRVLYGMAQLGNAPRIFTRIHPVTRTPVSATILVTVLLLLFALWLPILTLATITSFITLAIFSAMHLSLWRIKTLNLTSEASVDYPVWVPVLGFAISIAFILGELLIF